jgi:hypothetical protein
MQPRSELQALLAVQIIATGFAGLRFLRQSHRNMTEDYINVYGGYAIKLLRLQNEMIQTFERYRRGNKQTVDFVNKVAISDMFEIQSSQLALSKE